MAQTMPRMFHSNANFSPSGLALLTDMDRSAFWFGATDLVNTAEACGAGGVEIIPMRSVHYAQIITGRGAGRLAEVPVALHSGWRGIPGPQPAQPELATRPPRDTADPLVQHLATRMGFPHGERGMDRLLSGLQALGATVVSSTIYADPGGNFQNDLAKGKKYPNSVIQLDPDVAAAWGADTPTELRKAMQSRGLRAQYDTFAASREAKFSNTLLNPPKLLEELLAHDLVDSFRVSVFRDDFYRVDAGLSELSVMEGRALIFGDPLPADPHGQGRGLHQAFTTLEKHRWQGNVVVAAPMRVMTALNVADRDSMIQRYSQLTDGIKQQMSWINPEAWQPMPARQAA